MRSRDLDTGYSARVGQLLGYSNLKYLPGTFLCLLLEGGDSLLKHYTSCPTNVIMLNWSAGGFLSKEPLTKPSICFPVHHLLAKVSLVVDRIQLLGLAIGTKVSISAFFSLIIQLPLTFSSSLALVPC